MQLRAEPSTVAAVETFAGTVGITAVEAIPFALPYRRAPKFASGSVDSADNVLVRVHTDAGLVGQAEAQPRPYTYGETQTSIVDTVSGQLNDGADGSRPSAHRARRRALRSRRREPGRARGRRPRGVGPRRADTGMPCHTLLGGFADGVTAAHMVSLGEPAAMADEAIAISDQLGVRTFKVKVGRDPDLDVASVRAIRDALPDADLYVDANRGWSYEDAARGGRRAGRPRGAGDRGADLDRGPGWPAAPRRPVAGAAGWR